MDLPVPSEDDPKTAMVGPKTRNFSSLAALATQFSCNLKISLCLGYYQPVNAFPHPRIDGRTGP